MSDSPYDCEHDEVELRRRIYSNGTIHYTEQCLRCGAALRTFKHTSDEVQEARLHNGIPNFDETLRDTFYEQARQVYTAQREQGSAEWWIWYEAYLESAEWERKRAKVLERDNRLCQGCRKNKACHVHHLTYEHVGEEMLWELVSVCDECHSRIHGGDGDVKTGARLRATVSR